MLNGTLRPEQQIISEWRRAGSIASCDAREHVGILAWCQSKLDNHAVYPISRGDLALIMEYAPSKQIRQAAARLVLIGHVL